MKNYKEMVSEVQKGRVDGGLEFQSHITESFADLGLRDGQHLQVHSKKYTSTFNVDSHIEKIKWHDGDKVLEVHVLGEIKQSLKADGIYKVMAIADTFKDEHPNDKYVIFYKDGGIEDTSGDFSDFKKLRNYPSIDAVIPESEIRNWCENARSVYIPSEKPIGAAVNETLNRLITYDPAVEEYMTGRVIQTIDDVDKIKIIEAPTGFGKTYYSVNGLLPYFADNHDVQLVIFVAPQVALLTPDDLLPEQRNDFQFVGGLEGWGAWQQAKDYLELGRKVILPLSDGGMSDKVYNNIKKVIKSLGIERKVLIIRDEAHYAGSSSIKTTKRNLGNEPAKYSAAMFRRLSNLLKLTWVYYLTATPLDEQIDEEFGTDVYVKINDYPPKESLMLRTAKPNTPVFLPEARSVVQAGQYMNNFIERIFGAEEELRSFVNLKAKAFAPTELIQKYTGLIKLETSYPGKFKLDKNTIVEVFENCHSTRHFRFIVSIGEGLNHEKWRLYEYKDNKITDINHTFTAEGHVYKRLADKSDLLRFYVVVNKGSMGVNIPSLRGLLSFRTPQSEYNGEPVTIMGEQLLGRLTRLMVKVEDLYDYFDNKDDFIQYYTMVDSFDMIVEDFSYWRKTIEEFTKKLGSKSELIRYLYEEL